MRYYRCKCGKYESYGSTSPALCLGCDECGTSLATDPSLCRPAQSHSFVVEQVETDEGLKPLSRCRLCHRTLAELRGAREPRGASGVGSGALGV